MELSGLRFPLTNMEKQFGTHAGKLKLGSYGDMLVQTHDKPGERLASFLVQFSPPGLWETCPQM